jgi:hypothetical protein
MSKILKKLIQEYQLREDRGFEKYGTTMDRSDLSLSEWVQHALEEAMDLTLYLSKIKDILNDTQGLPNNQETSARVNEGIDPNRETTTTGASV